MGHLPLGAINLYLRKMGKQRIIIVLILINRRFIELASKIHSAILLLYSNTRTFVCFIMTCFYYFNNNLHTHSLYLNAILILLWPPHSLSASHIPYLMREETVMSICTFILPN